MNRLTRFLVTAPLLAVMAVTLTAQPRFTLTAPIPLDPAIRTGKLSNGLTYYVRRNSKPEKRLELRLVINAGSVLERDDQQGLAHFLEHMAFNGTKNFKKQELISFLEGIGMRFGADLNAYTTFDETVYMLQLPTEDSKIVDRGMLILEDWAHNLLLEGEEIDKERGVIMEEWRVNRNADSRMREALFPTIFYNSAYGLRLPIGKTDVLQSFKHQALHDFYRDWYRPDLMAVVAVGDYDPVELEKLIKTHFGRIPKPKNAPARGQTSVPDNPGTIVAFASDPEARGSDITVYYKHAPTPHTTVADYRRSLIEGIVGTMLNERLEELARSADPPFVSASTGIWDFNTAKRFAILSVNVQNNGHMRGMDAALLEIERARRHGFTQGELDRARANLLTSYEQSYNERDKNESGRFCREYVSLFLGRETAPGIEYEYNLARHYMPEVTLQDVNAVFSGLITEKNRIVTLSAPQKEGVTMPSEQEVLASFTRASAAKVDPYVDKANNRPLIAGLPPGGKVLGEKTLPEINAVEWTLSNGVRVILKPTEFKNDEVLMTAYSPGGNSLVPDADLIPAATAAGIVAQSGVGEFSAVELGKVLAGKTAGVTPYINELQEGLQGSSTPKDLETLFQLIYLNVTAPRRDETAFSVYRQQMETSIQNRSANPQEAFRDTLTALLSSYSTRRPPQDATWLAKLNLDRSLEIYRDRFADAGDFTFVFVGSFTLSQMRTLCERYLASLPSSGRKETWRDLGIGTLKGRVDREIRKGLDPKSTVFLDYSGSFDYARQNRFRIAMMLDILEIRLRESLREESGGTYSVGAFSRLTRWPKPSYDLLVSFGCAPDRVNDLIDKAVAVIDRFKQEGPTEEELAKVKEMHLRERETNLKQNRFWLTALQGRYVNNEDPRTIPDEDKLVAELTREHVQEAARRYFDPQNFIRLVLNPEK